MRRSFFKDPAFRSKPPCSWDGGSATGLKDVQHEEPECEVSGAEHVGQTAWVTTAPSQEELTQYIQGPGNHHDGVRSEGCLPPCQG